MFRKPPPLCVPGIRPAPECQKLLVHRADFKASAVDTVAECFVALKGDFLKIFHNIHFLVIWGLRVE